jgi:hypothetical protein
MRTRKLIVSIVSLLMIFSLVNPAAIVARAAEGAKIVQVILDEVKESTEKKEGEAYVKTYVRGVGVDQDVKFQISDIKSENVTSYSLAEDSDPMRTLIMVDNSFSIPEKSRGWIKDCIKAIVNAHGEKEQFRLATFSDDIHYMMDYYQDDYTIVNTLVDSIQHEDQETYLTDVLYDVVDSLNADNYKGFTRIIIFSDGVDNKTLGVTRDELNKMLDETPYPIYTFGFWNSKKSNNDELESMFALSRVSKCEYMAIEQEGAESQVAAITAQDNAITVFKAEIPLKAKTGGIQNTQLKLSDGTKLEGKSKIPFDVRAEASEEEKEDPPKPEPPKEDPPEEEEVDYTPYIIGGVAAGLLLIALIVLIIVLVKNKKKKNDVPQPQIQTQIQPEPYEKTEMLGMNRRESGTVHMTPDAGFGEAKRYRFALTDVADSSRTFKCELVNEIKIGRQPDNNIVLSDDTAVHGHQSKVMVENGVFYYADVKDVKNHSAVNDKVIIPEMKHLIVTNSRVKIGRHVYVISIT